VRIAVVGSGVSGLVAARLLADAHEVTVFEAADRLGGHVHTVEVDGTPVDTGFIVFNHATYPNFKRLIERLGVATQPSTMSFSVKCDRTGFEWNGTSLNGLFAQRRNLFRPSFLRMLRDVVRFNRAAPAVLDNGEASSTLGEYVARHGYSRFFVDFYLVPMGSAIWSMPKARLLEFPTGFFVRFFSNHGMLTVDDRPQWHVVEGGSRAYVDALVAPFRDRIRLSTPIRSVRRRATHVELEPGGRFDEVILACHSDQALRLLADPTDTEREVLGALPYQPNEVVLHTDASLLPRRRRAWAAWNYHVGGDDERPVAVTYNMNELQSLRTRKTYCVTLNRGDDVDSARVLGRFRYDHPVYSLAGIRAQARHGDVSGVNRTHYCGAYWGYGFHEDGVNSALAVAKRFGREL